MEQRVGPASGASGAAAAPDGGLTLGAAFAAQVAARPGALALVDDELQLTYGELDALAGRLAGELRALGLPPRAVVGIALERSAWSVVAMLGIVRADCVYLPLDLQASPARREAMLATARTAAVVIRRGGASHGRSAVEVDALPAGALAIPAPRAVDTDPAAVIFTSGSTGRPKGVRLTHGGIVNLVVRDPGLRMRAGDVVAQMANIAFDGATFEIWGALLAGARLDIVPRETMLAPHALAAFVTEHAVDVALLTSALLRHVVRDAPGAFARLRCLYAGGEVLDPGVVRAIFAHGKPQRIVNAYGPTEATTIATTYPIEAPPTGPIPIGRPIANVTAHVLDPNLDPVPVGTNGELYLGGAGVAPGYLDDPERTAGKFVPDPFARDPQARLYATGDVVRLLADGNLAFVGRRDREVKVRGFRFELDDVEAALGALPDVGAAHVALRDDDGERRVVAYVVELARPARSIAGWRAQLAATLPPYMLPDVVLALDALPLNANGKIDVAALAALALPIPATAAEPSDEIVAQIFADVLGHPIGPHEDFFAAGGHSLLAARVLARIREQCGVALSLRAFVDAPTSSDVARRVAAAPRLPDEPLGDARFTAHAAALSEAELDALLDPNHPA